MYSKQEASLLRGQFWTTFGQYLSSVPSAGGTKINWVNYKTGVRFIHFKMDADPDGAYIAIEIAPASAAQRKLYFDHFLSLRAQLHENVHEAWTWEEDWLNGSGRPSSRIYTSLAGVNVFRKEDWPAIISFFKPRLLGLDRFWAAYKDIFVMLEG
jgi:hypothetical protein